jgi:hypothetical protein
MKILQISLLLLAVFTASARVNVHKSLSTNDKIIPVDADWNLEDCIAAVVYTTENPIILTKRDFDRDSINGGKLSKDEVILQHIMAFHARVMYKMEVSEEVMEKYLQGIMDHHGISREQIKQMFAQVGYTFEEGLDQLKMMYLVDNLLSYKIKSRLVVTEEAIEKYYNDHPEYSTGLYTMQTGFIRSNDITEQQVSNWTKIQKTFEPIEWSDAYSLQDDEISQDRSFIKQLEPQEFSALEEVAGGFEVVRFISKRAAVLKTLDERHKSISEKLRAPMFEKLFSEFKKELLKEYEVIHMD